ncbi:cell wall metabolism sensor histidine kinase WalK [Mammaliicoccus fleurettii]|uniref:Sensor protein kinase WalK n=1 Tax=Mammaliicoccus fleurettii TaxID=150056 RepID=A0ABS5MN91_9STAP|nr:cell wall metabolism sensor histidine kinase WalK [Mammaliicoccus fleurettii]MBL0847699.1 cell wall metabolism sensor histidine kinase WalK [Mammaliicoccus fleurettii]MBS3672571.1 cell wall metabolism sensor histidine kinase WalK [Mammaliicoccus fleurettii]MBS3697385.1 cell wall metabolism sensor histidine kinase WalK [Mammaliicoccus fleurettii]
MNWLKKFQSLHIKLVVIYVLLIIIGMQIIGLYFTNSLEKELTRNFKTNIEQHVKQINYNIKKTYNSEDPNRNFQKEIQSILDDYAKRTEIDEIRFIDQDQIIVATSKATNQNTVNQKVNDSSVKKALSLGKANDKIVLKNDSSDSNRVWIKNKPVEYEGKVVGDIYVESDIDSVYEQLNNINQIFIIGTAISLLITIVLGFFIARTITKPISDMRNQTLEMSKGNYTQRVKIYGNDEIGELALSFNNLSKRVQEAQANTESEKRRLDSVITHMSDGVLATDRRGRVRIINEMALKMLGLERSDVEAKHILDILNIDDNYSLDDLQENNDSFIIDVNEEEGIIARVNFSTIIQDTGFINGYIAVLHDVTEQHILENERREFVANVSHELRTPLTSMRSYIEALEEGAWRDPEVAPTFLNVTREETDRMIRLVNDLLQLSKMDSSSDQMNSELIDFNMFINKIINRHEMTQGKNVTFIRDIPVKGLFVEIDPDKMTQVFDNVITNAIKYSQESHKRVEFHVKQNTLYNRMTIQIKDNGIGIPVNKVDKIFDRFYRVDKARARKMGGTGLGLAITKEIVEAHKGRIWANSKEGQGTSIYITLPCEFIEDEFGDWDA